jgi:DNA invertase Pin-like site-specific DNA recombinase
MTLKADQKPSAVRCAIYTRKSSEEGLDQAFNSLHAQREACDAYVLSQAGEGWIALPDLYDDGGFSGGNLERPALQRLLADITAGRVDTVVVYKIDRLTRSLIDFSKIVELLEAHGASFVSVTQAFNTTTSMGRLTLNVLLSFAQFERELTGERIRDKIAASKAKGMWMGGVVPLGYDLGERELVVNQAEAETVRQIYRRYLALGSVNLLREDLKLSNVRSKAWTTREGRAMGGVVIGRGALFHLLQNRLYLGEIQHRIEVYPGRHKPIVDRSLFDAVQQRLSGNRVVASQGKTRSASMSLRGKVFDAEGKAMSPSFAYGKGGRCYRYYISMGLQVGERPRSDDGVIRRIAADGLEMFLLTLLRRLLDRVSLDRSDVAALVQRVELGRADTQLVLDAAAFFEGRHRRVGFLAIQSRLEANEHVYWEEGGEDAVRIVLPLRLQLRGGRTSFTGGASDLRAARVDRGLFEALRSSHAELLILGVSPLSPATAVVDGKAPGGPHRRQLSRLPFLAPDLQRDILEGAQPGWLKLRTLLKTELPLLWSEQSALFASARTPNPRASG